MALACGGSVMPATGRAHWEGVEAADPATPAAVLVLESATARYTSPNAARLPWRLLFDGSTRAARRATELGTDSRSANDAAAQQTPAKTQQ